MAETTHTCATAARQKPFSCASVEGRASTPRRTKKATTRKGGGFFLCRESEGNPRAAGAGLLAQEILSPESPVSLQRVLALIPTVSVHTVRVDHELEVLSILMKSIDELEYILIMNIVITSAMSNLQHHGTI